MQRRLPFLFRRHGGGAEVAWALALVRSALEGVRVEGFALPTYATVAAGAAAVAEHQQLGFQDQDSLSVTPCLSVLDAQ